MPDPVGDPVGEVLALLGDDGNLPRLVEVLVTLDDKQRKKLSGPIQQHADHDWFSRPDQSSAVVAVLGCVTGVRQVAARLEWLELDDRGAAAAVEVLRARQPHWLPDLPAALLVGRERIATHFRLVRALLRAGMVERPDVPEYPLAMVRGLVTWHRGTDAPTVLDGLRADPALLEDEVPRLLRTEGAGTSLGRYDRTLLESHARPGADPEPPRPERTWSHALVTLADEGAIDRSWLLDAALGACFRDWTQGDVTWFVQLHDDLAPDDDDLAARQATYGRLLSVEHGRPVKLGLRSLRTLLRDGRLDLDVLLENAPAVLVRKDKGTVVDALELLADAGRAHAADADRIAEVAAHALTHERVDVQERALAVIGALVPDAGLAEVVGAHVDVLAASLQPAPPVARAAPADAVGVDPAPPVAAPVEPVVDVDELAELLARLVEEADDPIEVERLLDGVVRLGARRPARGADALAKRLRVLAGAYFPGPWLGQELRADLVQLGLVWLERAPLGRPSIGRPYGVEYNPGYSRQLARPDWSLTSLVTARVREVAQAVQDGVGPLLSMPTRRDGAIDADVLGARVASRDPRDEPLPLDAGLAVLRVPPDQHAELRLPRDHRGAAFLQEQLDLLRAQRPSWELVVGESKGLYRVDYPVAVAWRDPGSPEGSPERIVAAVLDRRDPLLNLALEAADGEYAGRFDQVTAMWPLMLPHHPDLLAAQAHPRFNRALTKNRSGTEPLLAALGAATQPIGPPTLGALVLGLAAKNGVVRTCAVDAVVDLSDRGLLDGAALGAVTVSLLATDAIVGSRLVPGLADAARSSGPAARVVVDCLAASLAALDGRRDAHHFVDLLAQLAIEQGRTVPLPESLAALARSTKSSMLAKACRRVPQPAPA